MFDKIELLFQFKIIDLRYIKFYLRKKRDLFLFCALSKHAFRTRFSDKKI
jgi:hypothetical protein